MAVSEGGLELAAVAGHAVAACADRDKSVGG